MLQLTLALCLFPADGQKNLPAAIPFADVTDDADGIWITVTLTVNTSEDLLDGKTCYGCESNDQALHSVCFKKGIDLDQRAKHVVTGRLRVIHHPAKITDEGVFEGFTEYRLEQSTLAK